MKNCIVLSKEWFPNVLDFLLVVSVEIGHVLVFSFLGRPIQTASVLDCTLSSDDFTEEKVGANLGLRT